MVRSDPLGPSPPPGSAVDLTSSACTLGDGLAVGDGECDRGRAAAGPPARAGALPHPAGSSVSPSAATTNRQRCRICPTPSG
ncbi:hypothetical protein NUM_59910 [Actinocatenispora comari]|uniref:Uncharacterized protein n=1 Tax=Actinocatenispora comari TaxID=2807577 RepID=A0A8J4AK04_9ACTN|nr:hypothetical protein NUM_59910 [Actinocatenispora comari]